MTSTIFEFGNLVSDRNEFDEWLRVVGLLPRNKKCPECGGQMKKEKSLTCLFVTKSILVNVRKSKFLHSKEQFLKERNYRKKL